MVNHILTVRGRKASVTPRTLVQGTVGQDTLTLDLDSEWNGLNVTVTFVSSTTELTPALTANVCEIPHEVLVDSGEVDVFVLGTRDGKAMRHASLAHKMVVKKSNMSDGSTSADPSISAYRQAYDDAVKATEAANSAAGAAGSAAVEMGTLNKRYAAQIDQQATDFSIAQTQRANDFSTAQTQRANDFSTAQTQQSHSFDSAMQGFENTFTESEKLRADAEEKRVEVEKERVKAEEQRAKDSKTRLEELAQAKTNVETATQEANTARDEAKSAATKANTAARKADGAAETAGTAAGTATEATKKADTAAGKADSAAGKAEASAGKADAASDRVDESIDAAKGAATAANNAADAANESAESASMAAQDARAAASEARGNPPQPVWDEAKQRYTNETMAAYAHSHKDGRIYGIKVPKSIITDCIKIGAAEGIAAPVPGTIGTPCVDPFTAMGKGPHWHEDVCGGADPDGAPFVDGIEGDGRFSLTDNGHGNNVYVMSNVVWNRLVEDEDPDYVWWYYSDTRKAGFKPNPQAFLPDGTLRPYMLTPKYPASKDSNGNLRSVSGAPIYVRKLSHDSGIDEAKTATTGYSLKSVYDDWYIKFSYITRYGTKNFQKMFTGCSNYNIQVAPVLAETGVKRVVVSAADGAKFLDGSCVSLGTHDTGNTGASVGTDCNTGKNYDVFDMKRIVSHETLDDGTVALNIECDTPFDTGTSYLLSTMPWWTGATDVVEGDGSPSSNTSGKEPCKVGGVEIMHGAYELVHGAMQKSEGDGWYFVINPDSRNEKKGAVAPGAIETGVRMVDDSTWPLIFTDAHGLLVGQGKGGNSNSGLCDCSYNSKPTEKGLREYLTSGSLWSGSVAGPWCVVGWGWLGWASWYICSRLSATGRGGEEDQAAQAA